jgi:hypothetical protein
VWECHCLLYSTAIDYCSTVVTVALSAVLYSDRLLFYRCYSGTVCWAVQRQIAVLPVWQWDCLLYSIAIDCCSTSVTVALTGVRYSGRLLFYRCYSSTVCCAVQRQIAVLPVLQWHWRLCSTTIDCCSTGVTVACLLYSTAIDCCSTGVKVSLSTVQYSDRLLFYRCEGVTVYCTVER